MGTTDNFDVPAKGSFGADDQVPIKDSVTTRGAYSLGSEIATFMQSNGVSVAAASTVSNTNYGIMTLSSAVVAVTLTAPTAGVTKIISALIASTAARTINAGTGATFDGTNNVLTSTGIQSVMLAGLSTARWGIISNYSPTTSGMTLSTA